MTTIILTVYKLNMIKLKNRKSNLISITILKNIELNLYNKKTKTKKIVTQVKSSSLLNFFSINEKILITGQSLGKGFASNRKCHNMQNGPKTHGSKHIRLQGSLGSGTTPGRVLPGKQMPKRLGNSKVTIKNNKIMYIDYNNNILFIKGSTPGKKGNILLITKQI